MAKSSFGEMRGRSEVLGLDLLGYPCGAWAGVRLYDPATGELLRNL